MTESFYRNIGSSYVKKIGFVCLMLSCVLLSVQSLCAAEPMLPQVYSEQDDVSGWLMSEKLDGVRGYWDGQQLFSKNGHLLPAPEEFVRDLPAFALEGELWGGRGTFEQTAAIIQHKSPHEGWLTLKFAVFDVPQAPGDFISRIEQAHQWFAAHPSAYAFVIPQRRVHDQFHLQRELERIQSLGGEGLIVRKPDALYRAGRSMDILKVKSYQDAEAKVVAHLPGKGRNKGRLGALLVELETGQQFKIGTGLSDEERENPPPIGALITFKFYGLYQSGTPKFPAFLRLRRDGGL